MSRAMIPWARRFGREDRGVALVEFAITLPLILVLFATTVDGARMLWSYQKAISGVRDATRYISRHADRTTCPGGDLSGYSDRLLKIVQNNVAGQSITPKGVTVLSVTPTVSCPTGIYRNGAVSVATVTATLEITLPFSAVFKLVGGDIGTFDATISDSTRIFGS